MNVLGIILAIILFMLLIVVHELGHMIAAKISGVGVDEFSVGMGPVIFNTKRNGTQYSLRAIPLGGYCKLSGVETDEEDESKENLEEDDSILDGNAFNRAPWYKKLFISFAGPFNNLVLCLLILFFVFLYAGSTSTTLASVTNNSPADLAGIKAGDTIISVDNVQCNNWNEVIQSFNNNKGELKIGLIRNGQTLSTKVTPEYSEEEGRYLIGITCNVVHSPKESIRNAFTVSVDYFKDIGLFFKELFAGHTENTEVVGVIGIVGIVSEEAKYGLINVIYLLALISLNLGVVNLLPIPGLDGGKILITLLRLISFGKITEKAERTVDAIGLAILFALAMFLIFKDTFNLFVK